MQVTCVTAYPQLKLYITLYLFSCVEGLHISLPQRGRGTTEWWMRRSPFVQTTRDVEGAVPYNISFF